MRKQIGVKTLFILFFIIATSLGNIAVSLARSKAIDPLKTETVSHESGKGPHSELEGTHFHLTTTGQTLIPKKAIPFFMLPTAAFYDHCSSLENFRIRKLSLRVKDYLFRIYPSHDFW
jgi:hypothetical protein